MQLKAKEIADELWVMASALLVPFLLLVPGGFAHGNEHDVVTIYVVSHGWHTGIVVPRREIPQGFWPGDEEFSDARFLEFGWGDAGFYQEQGTPLWETLKAALVPTTAVLHVVGFRKPVAEFFSSSGLVAIELRREAFVNLARFLDDTIVDPGDGRVFPLGSSLYGRGHFYSASGEYTLFNNCNHWVARALHEAGLRVDPRDAMTATAVFEQARRIGTLLRPEP